ncbi:restriction endonuclease [Leuconostoc sp. C2]|uniref:restriction endonuclease n=1 Tax=Leuconostoc sp. (strain C2) TaxID=979982 RepID=UPI0002174E71|nr:restriction endonuclease [Leuconostoc sp. C2]AEJ31743.1 mrr restriction system protein [Leuconostoc sp. C2]
MVDLNYDNFGIIRKITKEEANMPKNWLSFINSEKNLNYMEKFGVVAILKALQAYGGPTKAALVKEKASEYPFFTDQDREKKSSNGQSQLEFRLQWAMSNLKKAGLLHSPQWGVWALTQMGEDVNTNNFDVWDDVYSISTPIWQKNRLNNQKKKDEILEYSNINVASLDADIIEETDDSELWRDQLLQRLTEMNPYKFEELIVNLMRKIGIKMDTTSKSGDSGIDGIGYLRTPELMTYKIVLQTKRFTKGAVTGPDISNFAGTINGHNADRGIFVTTSTYTNDAISRSRQGANLITLVDGDELVDLLFEHRMGISEKAVVVINEKMFPKD